MLILGQVWLSKGQQPEGFNNPRSSVKPESAHDPKNYLLINIRKQYTTKNMAAPRPEKVLTKTNYVISPYLLRLCYFSKIIISLFTKMGQN